MKNNVTTLFVYGSLRSEFEHPAHEHIRKHFTLISKAKVKGLLYDTGEYPAAIPTTTEQGFITGELSEAKTPADFLLAIKELDAYEGVEPEDGEEPLFTRELTEVTYNTTVEEAWIYWYNGTVLDENRVASGDIMDLIESKSKL